VLGEDFTQRGPLAKVLIVGLAIALAGALFYGVLLMTRSMMGGE
jgi:hypothetical protein